MKSDKNQILNSLYEDNLYHVVRGQRRSKPEPVRAVVPKAKLGRTLAVLTLLLFFSSLTAFGLLSLPRPLSSDTASQAVRSTSEPAESFENRLTNVAPSLFIANGNGEAPYLDPASPFIFDAKPINISAMKISGGPQHTLASLFGLNVKTIVIDPGHGGRDPGAVGAGATNEKDITLALALELRDQLLQHDSFKVLLTREGDNTLSLAQRVAFANQQGADLFVSIHLNAFPSLNHNFVETYYFGANDDSEVVNLAALENADSDYHYADFRNMIQHIGDTLKFQESKQLAAYVQDSLVTNIKKFDSQLADHGIKPGPFVVLLGLESPAILTEIANLTSDTEEKRLKSSKYQSRIAKFLENGIVNYLNNKTTLGDRGNGREKEKLAKAWQ